MTLLVQDFNEGAALNGTTLTAGSGGNTAGAGENYLDQVTIGGTGAMVFNTSDSIPSSGACCAVTNNAGAIFGGWSTQVGTISTTTYFEIALKYTANPASQQQLVLFTDGTNRGNLRLNSAGTLATYNAGTLLHTFTNTIPLNTWFRVEGFMTPSTTAAEYSVSLYPDLTSSSATETQDSTGLVMGSTITFCRFGSQLSVTTAQFLVGYFGVSTTGAFGPLPGGGTNAPAGLPAATVVPPAPTASLSLDMTIQGV